MGKANEGMYIYIPAIMSVAFPDRSRMICTKNDTRNCQVCDTKSTTWCSWSISHDVICDTRYDIRIYLEQNGVNFRCWINLGRYAWTKLVPTYQKKSDLCRATAGPIHAKTEQKHSERVTQHYNNGRPTLCDPYRHNRKNSLVPVCNSYSLVIHEGSPPQFPCRT